jgi:hypothetical protein
LLDAVQVLAAVERTGDPEDTGGLQLRLTHNRQSCIRIKIMDINTIAFGALGDILSASGGLWPR